MQRKIKIFTMAMVLALGVCSLVSFTSCMKKPVEDVTVTISQKEIQLEVGETQKLTVKVEPADAQDKTIEWKSSDESVATVKDGEVTAVAEGEATITVTTNQKSDTCKVTVKAKGETPETPNGSNSGTESGAGSNSGNDSATNSDSVANPGSDSAPDSVIGSDGTATDSANGSQDAARRRR